MSVRNKPNYGIFKIDLSATGTQDLPLLGTRVVFMNALLGATFGKTATGDTIVTGGTVAPSTIVNLLIGRSLGDAIPMSINTKLNVDDSFEFARLAWAAQPNVTAFFLVDDDRRGAGIDADAPAAILGGSITVAGIVSPTGLATAADVACAAGAQTQLVASSATTRAALITNLAENAREIRIGDNGAGAAEGIPIYPGDTRRIKSSASIFAWNPHTAAMNVAVLLETN